MRWSIIMLEYKLLSTKHHAIFHDISLSEQTLVLDCIHSPLNHLQIEFSSKHKS